MALGRIFAALGSKLAALGIKLVALGPKLVALERIFVQVCGVFSFEWVDSLAEEPIVKFLAASDEL